MSTEKELIARSGGKCELCRSEEDLSVFDVSPSDDTAEKQVYLCHVCKGQIENPETIDSNHWHCLSESMWSEVPAVQVLAYRMLTTLSKQGWGQDLLDMLYLDDELKAWADAGISDQSKEVTPTCDSNGNILEAGDTVTIIKDLDVKGGGFTAKRGTVVKNISLTDNPEHIEGRVNGVRIVLVSKFLKKV